MCWNVHSMVDQTTNEKKYWCRFTHVSACVDYLQVEVVTVRVNSIDWPCIFQSHKVSLCLCLCLSRLNSRVWPKTHLWIVKIIGNDFICCCFTGPSINSHTHLPCCYDRITVQPNEPNGTETAFQVSARHSDNFPFDNNVVQFKFQYKKRIVLKRAHKCTYTKFICMCTQHYSVVFRVDVMCLPKLTQQT